MIELTKDQKNELKDLYEALYNTREEIENRCRGKQKQQSIFTCQVGKKYANAEIKFMLIGRCANGWEYFKPSTPGRFAERYVSEFVGEKGAKEGFDWIEKKAGKQYSGTYNLQRSRFWTYSRSFFEKLTEEQKEQYTKSRIWQDHIVQSDLYKMSPAAGGNPGGKAIELQHDICLALLKKNRAIEANAYFVCNGCNVVIR